MSWVIVGLAAATMLAMALVLFPLWCCAQEPDIVNTQLGVDDVLTSINTACALSPSLAGTSADSAL